MGFTRFHLLPPLFQAITDLGFAEPTPVQAQVIPEALKGRDIRACAQTGTGKTCAFGVPIVNKLLHHPPAFRPTVLILTPTRELATQVCAVMQSLTRHTKLHTVLIMGGDNAAGQIRKLRAGADILVATPGRLLDFVENAHVSLKHIHTFVLDEGDRMLDIGFLPDIRRIFRMLSGHQQAMLFSATFPPEIQQMVKQFLKDPVMVDISSSAPAHNVTQLVYPVARMQKEAFLQAILEVGNIFSAIIFCRTRHGASRLAIKLEKLGKSVTVIHSDRSQSQRNMALKGFKEKKFQILVATDIAARGIDVKGVTHVINYDVPENPEDYVHRIGRTGRAEAVGDAFTLVSPDEERYLRRIEGFIKKPIPRGVIPDFPYINQPNILSSPSSQSPTARFFHSQGGRHRGNSHPFLGRKLR